MRRGKSTPTATTAGTAGTHKPVCFIIDIVLNGSGWKIISPSLAQAPLTSIAVLPIVDKCIAGVINGGVMVAGMNLQVLDARSSIAAEVTVPDIYSAIALLIIKARLIIRTRIRCIGHDIVHKVDIRII